MTSEPHLPIITVITPVKNAVNSLEKAIQSLINQNYPNLEYIIIDGSSTDGTIDIIKKFEKNISYWHSFDDKNNIIAHIAGINKANGDIIAFLNADDFYSPEILKKAGEAFAQDPSLDMVSFRFRTIRDNKIIEEPKVENIDFGRNKIIQAPAMNARFFKRNLFHKYGLPIPYDNKGRTFISNDVEFLIRFALKNIKNKTIDYIGYNYVAHDCSLTFSRKTSTYQRLYEDRIFIAKKFLKEEKNLPKIWEKTFVKWIKKYRALLIASYLQESQFKMAAENFIQGIKENNAPAFIFCVIKTLLRGKKTKEVGF